MRMTYQGAFNFRCAKPVARHVEDIVDASHDPKIAVFVATRAIAGEIIVLKFAPVLLPVTRLVSVNRAQHGWPRLTDDQLAAYVRSDFAPLLINDSWIDTKKR